LIGGELSSIIGGVDDDVAEPALLTPAC